MGFKCNLIAFDFPFYFIKSENKYLIVIFIFNKTETNIPPKNVTTKMRFDHLILLRIDRHLSIDATFHVHLLPNAHYNICNALYRIAPANKHNAYIL